jgi:hypothetical protein
MYVPEVLYWVHFGILCQNFSLACSYNWTVFLHWSMFSLDVTEHGEHRSELSAATDRWKLMFSLDVSEHGEHRSDLSAATDRWKLISLLFSSPLSDSKFRSYENEMIIMWAFEKMRCGRDSLSFWAVTHGISGEFWVSDFNF